MKQWRICFANGPWDRGGGACFIDAPSEEAALKLFAVAFPNSVMTSIKLEPVDPCARYERKAAP